MLTVRVTGNLVLGRLPACGGVDERRAAGPTARYPFGTIHGRLVGAWNRSAATMGEVEGPRYDPDQVYLILGGKGLTHSLVSTPPLTPQAQLRYFTAFSKCTFTPRSGQGESYSHAIII